jgi:hypothetical protein
MPAGSTRCARTRGSRSSSRARSNPRHKSGFLRSIVRFPGLFADCSRRVLETLGDGRVRLGRSFVSAVPKDPRSSPVPISMFPSWMSPVRPRLPAPTLKPASRRAFLDVGHDWLARKCSTGRATRTVHGALRGSGPLSSSWEARSVVNQAERVTPSCSLSHRLPVRCVLLHRQGGAGGGVTWPEDREKRRFRCCPDWTRSTISAPSRSFRGTGT